MDQVLMDATASAITRWGLSETTLDRVAAEAGMSRATIYRRGVTREQLIAALTARAGQTFRDALWPALTGAGTAAERLTAALEALCAAADEHLDLFSPGCSSPTARRFTGPDPTP